ncbi:MAG: hypothetical protein ABEH43_07775 [Flavobacteriales bacterium]
MKRAAFITSTGRTGTWFLTKFINKEVENAVSYHEAQPHFKREGHKLRSREAKFYEKLYFSIPRKYRQLKHKEKWYIETNYHLYAAIEMIREVHNSPLIIHIIRDGREVVRSWLNKNRYITNDHVLPYHIPGDPARSKWEKWNPLQKLSWFWVSVNQRAEDSKPDLTLYYENIFKADKNSDIFSILNQLEGTSYDRESVINFFDKKINTNKNDFYPPYNEWPDHWKEQFLEIAEDTMKKHGYL